MDGLQDRFPETEEGSFPETEAGRYPETEAGRYLERLDMGKSLLQSRTPTGGGGGVGGWGWGGGGLALGTGRAGWWQGPWCSGRLEAVTRARHRDARRNWSA